MKKERKKNVASEIYANDKRFFIQHKKVRIKITETVTQPSRKINS